MMMGARAPLACAGRVAIDEDAGAGVTTDLAARHSRLSFRDLKFRSTARGGTADSGTAPDESPAAVDSVSAGAELPKLVVPRLSLARRPILRINDTNQLRPSRWADVTDDTSAVSCVTSLPWADAREGTVASSSELSQMCRKGRRDMCENYTAEDVKFTPSAAIPPDTAVRN